MTGTTQANARESTANRSFTCPACGEARHRETARFCSTCGRSFALEAKYEPTDSLRASYRTHKTISQRSTTPRWAQRQNKAEPTLFTPQRNASAKLALAFVVYALVPFLGILFCPGAVVCGGWALRHAHRESEMDGAHAAWFSIICGVATFVAQLALWWLLYTFPPRSGF